MGLYEENVSDSLIPISDEQAKLGQEVLKTLRGLGAFLGKALGSTPEDLVGYLGGDWLRVRRGENIARMLQKARERLQERGVAEPRAASLSVALPILRGVADEDRDELVDLWARLLANAMDPKRSNVRYEFIETVKKMNPIDAMVIKSFHERRANRIGDTEGAVSVRILEEALHHRSDEILISFEYLANLGFFQPVVAGSRAVSPFGREFMRACYPENEG
jgi:hypothetical protein